MQDHPFESGKAAQQNATDEHNVLNALLQKLEQSENLTLDELDAVIIQADSAYKSRLARLQKTRQMIDQLGMPAANVGGSIK